MNENSQCCNKCKYFENNSNNNKNNNNNQNNSNVIYNIAQLTQKKNYPE